MRAQGALVTALLSVLLVACSPSAAEPQPTAPPGAPTSAPATATPTADPTDPAVVRESGTPVTSGPVTLWVTAPAVDVRTEDDGSVRVSAPAGSLLLAAPAGATVSALTDGSAVVLDAAGAFLGGLTSDPWDVQVVQVGPEVVRLTTDSDQTATVSTGFWFTASAVASAVWGEAEGGRSLAVTPTAWARAGSQAAREGLWAQVVALAPDADLPGMRAQLECHELGAPDKATWNLEPWRPEVDAIEMIRSRCNPS